MAFYDGRNMLTLTLNSQSLYQYLLPINRHVNFRKSAEICWSSDTTGFGFDLHLDLGNFWGSSFEHVLHSTQNMLTLTLQTLFEFTFSGNAVHVRNISHFWNCRYCIQILLIHLNDHYRRVGSSVLHAPLTDRQVTGRDNLMNVEKFETLSSQSGVRKLIKY